MITPAHQAYNDFVQMVQREASAFGMECRIEPIYSIRQTNVELKRAELQVYWDGVWHSIAGETPFPSTDKERRMQIDPDKWEWIKAKAADALVNS